MRGSLCGLILVYKNGNAQTRKLKQNAAAKSEIQNQGLEAAENQGPLNKYYWLLTQFSMVQYCSQTHYVTVTPGQPPQLIGKFGGPISRVWDRFTLCTNDTSRERVEECRWGLLCRGSKIQMSPERYSYYLICKWQSSRTYVEHVQPESQYCSRNNRSINASSSESTVPSTQDRRSDGPAEQRLTATSPRSRLFDRRARGSSPSGLCASPGAAVNTSGPAGVLGHENHRRIIRS